MSQGKSSGSISQQPGNNGQSPAPQTTIGAGPSNFGQPLATPTTTDLKPYMTGTGNDYRSNSGMSGTTGNAGGFKNTSGTAGPGPGSFQNRVAGLSPVVPVLSAIPQQQITPDQIGAIGLPGDLDGGTANKAMI